MGEKANPKAEWSTKADFHFQISVCDSREKDVCYFKFQMICFALHCVTFLTASVRARWAEVGPFSMQ